MLILEADIKFDTQESNKTALKNDLDTKYIIRPAINFGNDILFSGDIIPINNVKMLIRGEIYRVSIEMPTIDKEAYNSIKNILEVGGLFKIQNASRVVGSGILCDFIFE